MLLVLGCTPDGVDTSLDTSVDPATCVAWPVEVADAPLFGGNDADSEATGEPGEWPIDVVRELVVQDGLVQRTHLTTPMWGDFKSDAGLRLEGFWTDDGGFDVQYDSALVLYPLPLEGAWTSEASFSDATVAFGTNQGVDAVSAAVVDTVDLDLDSIVFSDVSVIESTWTRTLAVSTGPTVWTETAWVHPCHGVLARRTAGQGMRFLP